MLASLTQLSPMTEEQEQVGNLSYRVGNNRDPRTRCSTKLSPHVLAAEHGSISEGATFPTKLFSEIHRQSVYSNNVIYWHFCSCSHDGNRALLQLDLLLGSWFCWILVLLGPWKPAGPHADAFLMKSLNYTRNNS